MKWFMFVILLLSGCAASATNTRENALVTEVTDGDTIVVAGGERVRILGINAPERGEKGYKEARAFLQENVLNKEVILESDGANRDRYDRLLRHVWHNSKLTAEALAHEGLARAKYFDKNQEYREQIAAAEQEAITAKKGLWR